MTDEARQLADKGEADSARTIERESQRMLRQIDYHLARARTAAPLPIPGQGSDVADLLAQIVPALRRLHADRHLTIDVRGKRAIAVACDPVDLGEILSNLIDNACKWAGSRVEIAWRARDDRIEVSVDDDGPGIPISARDKVFATGERLDDTTPGTGLGLAITRDLTQLYGGSVSLLTSPLGGVRACVRLPLAS